MKESKESKELKKERIFFQRGVMTERERVMEIIKKFSLEENLEKEILKSINSEGKND